MDGIINIYKERGFTSHDVVAKLRGILKQKKIGHTGTLDPEAEGVLPVCLGKATKVCDLLTDKDKTYRAVLRLGASTDTQDLTGTVLEEAPVEVSEDQVRQVIMSFVGDYDQVPPMYSALKVNGKKLYELARAGKEVERAARRVRIEEIVIESIDLPEVTMSVTCSKGTYIRTLCHDIGEAFGCHGAMKALLRTRVSTFCLEQAKTLAQVEQVRDEGRISELLIPVDALFLHLERAEARPGCEKMLYNGNGMYADQLLLEKDHYEHGETIRLYDMKQAFMGIYSYDNSKKLFMPVKIFYSPEETK